MQNYFLRRTDVAYTVEQFSPVGTASVTLQPLVVHCESFDDILLQSFGSPPTEVRGNHRFDSISQRDNHIEIIISHVVGLAISGSCSEFPNN